MCEKNHLSLFQTALKLCFRNQPGFGIEPSWINEKKVSSVSASQLRRVTFLACLFLVLLRVSIGWQFFYEGMWKYQSQSTSKPWTAAGYLKNAQGPLRDYYRGLVHDPDDLEKLDYDKVVAMWDGWHARFLAAHPDLDDRAKKEIDLLLNGPNPPQWARPLEVLPENVDVTATVKSVTYNADKKRLISTKRIIPKETAKLLALVEVIEKPTDEQKPTNEIAKAYHKAVKDLGLVCSRLSLKEKLEVSLKWDKNRAGVTITEKDNKKLYADVAGTLDEHRPGEIELYKNYLERYEANLKKVTEEGAAEFSREHLAKQWGEIQQQRGKLVGPVNAWSKEIIAYAEERLGTKQLQRGRVPMQVGTKTDETNQRTIWTLLILGVLMILGLFSRLSAFASAGLLLMFYLAMPPFPGVPPAPGPEHSLFVNKNLIEVLACLALASLPTGRWFGVDGFVSRVIFRQKD